MRVLIVGGTGVISTPLSARLIAAGHEVVHCNRGERPARGPAPAGTIVGDRTDFSAFEAAIAAAGTWDCVYDMVVYRPEEAASAVRAFRGRTRQYVLCSTVDTYAKPAPRYPIDEDSPLGGVSAYGIAKRQCEAILMAAHDQGDLPVTILRPAYTYGPGARGVLHSLGFDTRVLDRLARGLPVIVHDGGTSLWAFGAAEDVASAFAGALGNGRALGRVYNVTGDATITWADHLRRVAAAMGWPAPALVPIPTEALVRLLPERSVITAENLRFSNVFSNARAKAELGLACATPLEEGMRRLILWLDAAGRIDRLPDPDYEQAIERWQGLLGGLARERPGVP
jgi:nucleoside-diphosphate-sugar epimerase